MAPDDCTGYCTVNRLQVNGNDRRPPEARKGFKVPIIVGSKAKPAHNRQSAKTALQRLLIGRFLVRVQAPLPALLKGIRRRLCRRRFVHARPSGRATTLSKQPAGLFAGSWFESKHPCQLYSRAFAGGFAAAASFTLGLRAERLVTLPKRRLCHCQKQAHPKHPCRFSA